MLPPSGVDEYSYYLHRVSFTSSSLRYFNNQYQVVSPCLPYACQSPATPDFTPAGAANNNENYAQPDTPLVVAMVRSGPWGVPALLRLPVER